MKNPMTHLQLVSNLDDYATATTELSRLLRLLHERISQEEILDRIDEKNSAYDWLYQAVEYWQEKEAIAAKRFDDNSS